MKNLQTGKKGWKPGLRGILPYIAAGALVLTGPLQLSLATNFVDSACSSADPSNCTVSSDSCGSCSNGGAQCFSSCGAGQVCCSDHNCYASASACINAGGGGGGGAVTVNSVSIGNATNVSLSPNQPSGTYSFGTPVTISVNV